MSSNNDAVNDIVIRGNSPNGLLWRLEGVSIPNPNHFGGLGATGGPVSMLNNNLLANSDFMTSAFPAEYGDALSGVFDINLRKGNYDKFEFLGQIGFNGLELGVEGPLNKKNNGSFIANYRYSTIGFMSAIGINVGTGSAIPYYQDLSFNLNMPTKKAGTFSIFGLGGINHIDFVNSAKDSADLEEDFYTDNSRDIYAKSKMGVIGLKHTYLINSSTYTRLVLSASYFQNQNIVDSISQKTYDPVPFNRSNSENTNLIASFYINKKFSVKDNFRVGLIYNRIVYNLIDSTYFKDDSAFRIRSDENGATTLGQAYVEWQHKFTDELILNTGLHFQGLSLNSSLSLEPRVGLRWIVKPKHTLNLAYGMHSQTQMPQAYFTRYLENDGMYYTSNEGLNFNRAHHVVLAYDWNITPDFRLKVETYYQHLYDIPVERFSSNYSMLNLSSMYFSLPDSLVNEGTGRNYGVEFTFEKFLSKGLYFLFTTSLFDSKYKGSDGVSRSTAFDSKYVVNLLAGKELEIKSKKDNDKLRRYLVFDGRMTTAGGQRYIPIDLEKSQEEGQTVYQEEKAFSEQLKPYFRLDLRVAFRMVFRKSSHEIAFDVQNVTNRQNPLFVRYNSGSQQEEIVYQIGIFPMVQYRVNF